jgi:hypothetical protein
MDELETGVENIHIENDNGIDQDTILSSSLANMIVFLILILITMLIAITNKMMMLLISV